MTRPPRSLQWTTSTISCNAVSPEPLQPEKVAAEELFLVARVWRHGFQQLRHSAEGALLPNSTGNQGNQMGIPRCQAGSHLSWSLKGNRQNAWEDLTAMALWRSQLSGQEENLGVDVGKNLVFEHVCVGHCLCSILPLNTVTLDKFHDRLEVRINNPYLSS